MKVGLSILVLLVTAAKNLLLDSAINVSNVLIMIYVADVKVKDCILATT